MDFVKLWGMISRFTGPLGLAVAPLAGCAILAYIMDLTMGFNFAVTFFILLCFMGYLVISGSKKVEEQKKLEAIKQKKIAALKAKREKEEKERLAQQKIEDEKAQQQAHEKARQQRRAEAGLENDQSADEVEEDDDIVPLRTMQSPLEKIKADMEAEKKRKEAEAAAAKEAKQKQKTKKRKVRREEEPKEEIDPLFKPIDPGDVDLENVDLSEFDDPDFKI